MTGKRLYRSRKDRVLWGVAGGLAEYLDVDPVLVRVGFVLLAFAWGITVVAYIILAIAVPSEPMSTAESVPEDEPRPEVDVVSRVETEGDRQREEEVRRRRRYILGGGLVIVGAIILIGNLGWWWFTWHLYWPVLLIAVGVAILVVGTRRR